MANGVACDEGYARMRANFARWRVPSAIIDDLVDHRSAVSYPRGAVVFMEGSPGDLFGCVLAGYVKVYCNSANGRECWRDWRGRATLSVTPMRKTARAGGRKYLRRRR